MTEKRKQHHPLSGGKRITAYTFAPSDLVLVTDKSDPLYDARVEDEIGREFLLSIASRGVETPIAVRARDGQNIVVRGKQRTKTVHVVNALAAGQPYTGNVKAIHSAIKTFGRDAELVKLLVQLTRGKPLQLRTMPSNRGDERDARMSMRTENAHRRGDALAERIKFVQDESEKYGTDPEELAMAEGVSVATIKRWLKADANGRSAKKKRATPARPSHKQIGALLEQVGVHMTEREQALFAWVLGRSNGRDVAEMFLGTSEKTEHDETRAVG